MFRGERNFILSFPFDFVLYSLEDELASRIVLYKGRKNCIVIHQVEHGFEPRFCILRCFEKRSKEKKAPERQGERTVQAQCIVYLENAEIRGLLQSLSDGKSTRQPERLNA